MILTYIVPVSYTHLDVYKRQLSYYNKMKVLYFAKIPGALFIFYIVFNLIVSVFGLNEFSIQGYIMPNVHGNIIGEIVLILLIFGLSIGIIPVSYTHLDVYKRQAFIC